MPKIKFPCSACELEFDSNQELIDHRCTGSPLTAKKKVKLPPELEEAIRAKKELGFTPAEPVKKEPKPLVLFYRYEGDCPTCFKGVDTIELENGKKSKVSMVAWCNTCKKQLKVQEVSKL